MTSQADAATDAPAADDAVTLAETLVDAWGSWGPTMTPDGIAPMDG